MTYLLSRALAQSVKPPAPSWLWKVLMPSLPGFRPSEIVVEEIDFPLTSVNAVPRYGGGKNTYYPGAASIEPATISFYEDEDFTVTRYLQVWKNLVRNDYSQYGMPINFKKTIEYRRYNNQGALSLSGILVGCWPSTISSFSSSYNESGRTIIRCTFSTDDSFV